MPVLDIFGIALEMPFRSTEKSMAVFLMYVEWKYNA